MGICICVSARAGVCVRAHAHASCAPPAARGGGMGKLISTRMKGAVG